MRLLKWTVIALLVTIASMLAMAQLGWFVPEGPLDIGIKNGRLKQPSVLPNSVSSQARLWPGEVAERSFVEPFRLVPGTDGPTSIKLLSGVVEVMPGMRIVNARQDYFYAQATSRVLKLVDDIEFWWDPALNVIQVRSASRVGRHDLGANRERVEKIRAAFQAVPPPSPTSQTPEAAISPAIAPPAPSAQASPSAVAVPASAASSAP